MIAAGTVPAEAQQGGGPQSVAPLAEKLIDAVVNISTTPDREGAGGRAAAQGAEGRRRSRSSSTTSSTARAASSPPDRKVSSLGSGFVVDGKEGLVVTNNHVIEGADEIIVNFHDGTKLKVDKVLGKDTKTDLALLKVTPKKPLPAVHFGSSAKMKVGDWVMAIGNPFGLGGSVTVGIISAKQRDINSGPYDDYLQTDAAINKGNSGGPLFNMDGEVIGVNTAIISPTGGSIGIGFAVPSDTATCRHRSAEAVRRDAPRLARRQDPVRHRRSRRDARRARRTPARWWPSVTPDSPAAKAGIQDGDVILKFDGKDVTSMRGLPRLVAQTPIGKDVDVELLRKGQRTTLKVAVGRLAEEDEPVKATAKDVSQGKGKGQGPRQGSDTLDAARVAPDRPGAGPAQRRAAHEARHRRKDMKGVIVLEVDPDEPGREKGVKVGDVIVEAAQEASPSLDDVVQEHRKGEESRPQGRPAAHRGRQGRHALRRGAADLNGHSRKFRRGFQAAPCPCPALTPRQSQALNLRPGALNSGHALPINDPGSPRCPATTCSRPSPTAIAPVHRDGHKFVAIGARVWRSCSSCCGRRWPGSARAGHRSGSPTSSATLTASRRCAMGWSSPPADGRVSMPSSTCARRPSSASATTERLRISIFLSVLIVHINRAPVAGKIIRSVYVPGAFLNAAARQGERG